MSGNSISNIMAEADANYDKQAGIGVNKTYVPNPGISLLFFFIVTTVLFIAKLFMLPKQLKGQGNTMNIIMLCIYLFLLIIGNYFINMSTTSALCGGTPQWGTTFIITLLPWILIFAVINMLLIVYPGWLIPFSNTIGYFGAKIGGLNDLFNDHILKPRLDIKEEEEKIGGKSNLQIAKALQQIYGNETLLINEIPRDGDNEQEQIQHFKDFITSMSKIGIFKKNIDEGVQLQLYNLLKIKDIVAEYIWYLLSGFLVTSISYNYIVNVGCTYSAKQMKTSYDKYISEESKSTGESKSTDSNKTSAKDLTESQKLIFQN